jgi:hypothetical protein
MSLTSFRDALVISTGNNDYKIIPKWSITSISIENSAAQSGQGTIRIKTSSKNERIDYLSKNLSEDLGMLQDFFGKE